MHNLSQANTNKLLISLVRDRNLISTTEYSCHLFNPFNQKTELFPPKCRNTPRPRPKNPCNPSSCGPGTTCSPSPAGNPICRCKAGLIPNPDTITGCKPECVRDPDCQHGYVCQSQRCVEKPDPCNPSPCGPRTTCTPNSIGNPICR